MLQTEDIRQRLTEVENKVRALREERARAAGVKKAAVAAVRDDDDASLRAAEAASEALQAVEAEITAVGQEQVALLKSIGDFEAGRSGFTNGGVNGWETAARTLSLTEGNLRADVSAASLLLGAQPVRPSPSAHASAAAPASVSNDWLFPVFEQVPFGAEPGDIVATDYTASFLEDELTGTLTGGSGVEREVDAVTEKATMTPTVALATPKAKQYAAVLNAVPSKVFESQASLQALLQNELARQLARSFDAAVLDAIEAADPPNSTSGSDLVSKIRNAISKAVDLGSEPSVIGLSPADAAALDLADDGSGAYLFLPSTDSQAVVWRLQVREVPGITAPTLVDPQKLGLIYTGEGSVLVDPFSSMTTNQVRIRVETEAVLHIRNIQQGAYQIVA